MLLPGEMKALCGDFRFPAEENGAITFEMLEKDQPCEPGERLACLGAYWRPYHVWAIEAGLREWQEAIFASTDAVVDRVQGSDGSWLTRLREASPEHGLDSGARIQAGGWDHEHCMLCDARIEPDDRYFRNLQPEYEAFLCVGCYERHVPAADISFAVS